MPPTLSTPLAPPRRETGARFHYAWVVAGVTFLALIVAAGIRASPSVLMVPIETETGWTRATISLAVAANILLYGLFGPFAAALMQKYGLRRVVVIALLALAAGTALTTFVAAPWQLVMLWGVGIGLGTGTIAMTLGALVVNRWFVARRGLVLGVLSAAVATGQLVFLPLLAEASARAGWRRASLVVAVAALALVPIVAFFMRDHPREKGLRAFGATAADADAPATLVGNPLATAFAALGRGLRSADFWLLSGTFFICGLSTNGLVGTHLIPASMDHGMTQVAAAGLLAVMGVFDLVGTTLSGWLTDRWDSRRLLFWYYALRGLALLGLPFALGGAHLAIGLFVVFYGLDWVATVPPTVRLASNVWGPEGGGIMFGWIAVAHQLGAATAALGAGALRTSTGSYTPAFLAAGGLCLLAAALTLRMRDPMRDRTPLAAASASGAS